jgi:hypothetical protein
VNAQLFESMINSQMGELDNSAIIGVLEQAAGVNLLDAV